MLATEAPSCSTSGCPKDRIFAIRDEYRLYRLTFSRSLADHICKDHPGLWVESRRFVLGEVLGPNTVTGANLFAICSKSSGFCLRIALRRDLAELLTDDSRELREAWLITDAR